MLKLALLLLLVLSVCGCHRATSPGSSSLPGGPPGPGEAAKKLPALTLESIAKMSDDDLHDAVTGRVLSGVNYSAATERQMIAALTEGEKIVYTTTTLEGEVFNGGFHQYFCNTSGELAEDAIQHYRLIGAPQHAAITAKSIELAAKEEGLRASIRASDDRLRAFSESYKQTKLSELDGPFYDLEKKEDVRKLRAAYIRKHAGDFAAK